MGELPSAAVAGPFLPGAERINPVAVLAAIAAEALPILAQGGEPRAARAVAVRHLAVAKALRRVRMTAIAGIDDVDMSRPTRCRCSAIR